MRWRGGGGAHLGNHIRVWANAAQPVEFGEQLNAEPPLPRVHLAAQVVITKEVLWREVVVDLIDDELLQAEHVHRLRLRPVRLLRPLLPPFGAGAPPRSFAPT